MAYVTLVAAILNLAGWAAGLLFTMKTGKKTSLPVPAMGVIGFGMLIVFSIGRIGEAGENPPQLTTAHYLAMEDGLDYPEVLGMLGTPSDLNPRNMDLAGKGISIPKAVSSLLGGENHQDAIVAKLNMFVNGEPGYRGRRESLGAKAADENNGLVGMDFVIMALPPPPEEPEEGAEEEEEEAVADAEEEDDEDKEWAPVGDILLRIKEGKPDRDDEEGTLYFEYSSNLTGEEVAQELTRLIDETDEWVAEYGGEELPTKITIIPELEEWMGAVGNRLVSQVVTGANSSVKVAGLTNGGVRPFRGGQDDIDLRFWFEKDRMIDGNFSVTDRLLLVGFIGNKVAGMSQSGIPQPPIEG
jgi:hypothetical protein